jgi:H+/gluconate symporter-like permease
MLIAGLVIGALSLVCTIYVHGKIFEKFNFWNEEKDVNHESPVSVSFANNDTVYGLASLSAEEMAASVEGQNNKKLANTKGRPGFLISMLPIIIPVICILIGTVSTLIYGAENIPQISQFLGEKLIAILLGTLVAYAIGYKYLGKVGVEKSAGEALKTAGIVLLVTGAGGSFGAVIKATDMGNHLIKAMGINSNNVVAVLLFAYFIGFIFRIAQGSGTVAGITAMTIMASMATTVPVHPVYIALACLAGGNSIGHVNDSGFWVATNLSGLTVTGGLKTYTTGIFISTIFIMIFTIIGAVVLPMV